MTKVWYNEKKDNYKIIVAEKIEMGLFSKEVPATPKAPEVLDNVNRKVIDYLKETIRKGSKVSISRQLLSLSMLSKLSRRSSA